MISQTANQNLRQTLRRIRNSDELPVSWHRLPRKGLPQPAQPASETDISTVRSQLSVAGLLVSDESRSQTRHGKSPWPFLSSHHPGDPAKTYFVGNRLCRFRDQGTSTFSTISGVTHRWPRDADGTITRPSWLKTGAATQLTCSSVPPRSKE